MSFENQKKEYQKPEMKEIPLEIQGNLLVDSDPQTMKIIILP